MLVIALHKEVIVSSDITISFSLLDFCILPLYPIVKRKENLFFPTMLLTEVRVDGPSLMITVGGTTDRGQWTMETPAQRHHAAPGDPVMSLKMAEIRRCKPMERDPIHLPCGTTRKVTTINGGKGRQWSNGNGEFPCGHAAWKPVLNTPTSSSWRFSANG